MDVHEAAWKSFFEQTALSQNGGVVDNGVLAGAITHIEDCGYCMAKWESLQHDAERSISASKPATEDSPEWSIVHLVAKATGLPAKEISLKTELGPFQIANVLILLVKMSRFRRIKPHLFFPDRMTVGGLLALWEKSSALPEYNNRSLAPLEVPA